MTSPYQKLKKQLMSDFEAQYREYYNSPEKLARWISLSFDSIAHSVAEAGKVDHRFYENFDDSVWNGANSIHKQSQKQLEEYFGQKV